MSVRHRFTAITLSCALVGACATSQSGVARGDTRAVLQQESVKFLILIAGGTGRGPFLKRYGKDIRDYSKIEQISVSYSNANVRKTFDDALNSEIIAKNTGKKIVCDCKGRFIKQSQGKEFEISSFAINFEGVSPE